MIGTIIGNYKIIKELGTGGMGTVYLAENRSIGLKVAIKVLHAHLIKSQNIKKRFLKEAKTQAILDHPNITKVIDYVDNEKGLFIILEYIKGEELNEYLFKTKGLMPENDAIHYMSEILDAVQYAHNKGVIHRDLKSANIMITPNKGIKIMDFGIAKLAGESLSLTKTGSRIGSPLYMSPEQVTSGHIDHRSDIYSLGVVFHEMLTGLPVYDQNNTTEFEIYNKIVRQPLPRLKTFYKHVSNYLQVIVDTATSKLPEGRFQSCLEFKQALTNNSLKTGSPKLKSKPNIKKEKSNSALWVIGLIAICLLGIGGYFYSQNNKDFDFSSEIKEEEKHFDEIIVNPLDEKKEVITKQEIINDTLPLINNNIANYKYDYFIIGKETDTTKNRYANYFNFISETKNIGKVTSSLIAKTNGGKNTENFKIGDTVFLSNNRYLASIKNKETLKKNQNNIENIPFKFVEKPPTFGKCRGKTNSALEKCFEKNIKNFLLQNYNKKLYNSLGLASGYKTIDYFFIISKTGEIFNSNVNAEHAAIINDVQNIINSISTITPGEENNEKINVRYEASFKVYVGKKKEKEIVLKQEEEQYIEVSIPSNLTIHSVDQAPVYAGCENLSGFKLAICSKNKIDNFISSKTKSYINSNMNVLQQSHHIIDISFTINNVGSINSINIQTNNESVKKEVKRIVKTIPQMQPALYKNIPVAIKYDVTIEFK